MVHCTCFSYLKIATHETYDPLKVNKDRNSSQHTCSYLQYFLASSWVLLAECMHLLKETKMEYYKLHLTTLFCQIERDCHFMNQPIIYCTVYYILYRTCNQSISISTEKFRDFSEVKTNILAKTCAQ